MKLYYSPGACSLATHIVAREAGLPFDLVRVDLKTKSLETGEDYLAINPRGYVPAVDFGDGEIQTEVAALLQYLADQSPQANLALPAGSKGRLHVNQWLAFASSELHKAFGPWLFQAEAAESTVSSRRDALVFGLLERSFARV